LIEGEFMFRMWCSTVASTQQEISTLLISGDGDALEEVYRPESAE